MHNDISAIHKVINYVAKFPGLGMRSARRVVLDLVSNKQKLSQLVEMLQILDKEVVVCSECGNFDCVTPCNICSSKTREQRVLCVVESVSDLWALERSLTIKCKYHVIGGLLSMIDNNTPDKLRIDSLITRVKDAGITEVILAINATIEGQTTLYYISDMLKQFDGLKISRLAFGVPIGANLDYLDEGTLNIAVKSRKTL